MSGVSELPKDYVTINNDKNFNSFPEDIGEQLKKFYEESCDNIEVSIGHSSDCILVRAFNKLEWRTEYHELLCKQFNVMLTSFDKIEHYEPSGYTMELDFLYLKRFANEKYNKECCIDFNEVLRMI